MTGAEVVYPRRGQIWWTDFPTDPQGKGRRPVVVVSIDGRNSHPRSNTVLVVPLSTSIQRPSPYHLPLSSGETGLREDGVAKAEDVCTLKRADLVEPVQGHRPVTNRQICRLAQMVVAAMGCVD